MAKTQTIVVITETGTDSFTDEFEIGENATDEEIQEEAREYFNNRCSWGWHRKDEKDG